jgi:hypothetical protein
MLATNRDEGRANDGLNWTRNRAGHILWCRAETLWPRGFAPLAQHVSSKNFDRGQSRMVIHF